LYSKRVRGLRKLLNNKEATAKAGEEHQKAIDSNLKECFEYVVAIVEELLAESNYSAADVANRARKVLSSREKALTKAQKKGDFFETVDAENRYNHAKALASLPNPEKSGVSAKKLDKAAFNAAHKRFRTLNANIDNYKDNDEVFSSPEYKRAWKASNTQREYGERKFDAQFGIKKPYDKYKATGNG
jgi:hypothetical protein